MGLSSKVFTHAEMHLCDMCVSAREEEGHAMFAFVFFVGLPLLTLVLSYIL